MIAKWLTDNLGTVANTPQSVEKLRALFLRLALTGKLQLQGARNTDAAGWSNVRLDQVATITMGNSPPGESYNERGDGVPLVNGPVEFSAGPFGATVKTKYTTAPTKFCKPGELLICVRGSTTGRTNIAAFDACIGRGVASINAREHQPFVNLVVWSLRDYIFSLGTGSTFPSISYDDLASLTFLLPSLAEQKRIVAKVDELMALCDELEAQQREREERKGKLVQASLARFAAAPTPDNLQFLFHKSYDIPPANLRKMILTLAVQGKLVRQEAGDEPASQSFARLGLTTTLSPSNIGSELPLPWRTVNFEDVAITAGGVTLGRKLGDRKTLVLPYLRVANVKRGEIDLESVKEVAIAEDELERYALRPNDLLMIEGGDWDKVGRAAIWRGQIPVCLHQNHVFRSRLRTPEMSPEWFELYFNSPPGRAYFESCAKQTTNLASINMRQVRSCPVPIPPFAEQRRIVAKVTQLMALVDELEWQLEESRATGAKLLEAIVRELTTCRFTN